MFPLATFFTTDLFYSRRSFTASPVRCQSNGILKRTKFIILTWHLDPQFVVVSLLENSNFFGLSFMKTCLKKSEINKLDQIVFILFKYFLIIVTLIVEFQSVYVIFFTPTPADCCSSIRVKKCFEQ